MLLCDLLTLSCVFWCDSGMWCSSGHFPGFLLGGDLHYLWHFSKSATTRSTLLRILKVHHSSVKSSLEKRLMTEALSFQGGVAENRDLVCFCSSQQMCTGSIPCPRGGPWCCSGAGVSGLWMCCWKLLSRRLKTSSQVKPSGEWGHLVMSLAGRNWLWWWKLFPLLRRWGGNQRTGSWGWVFSSNTLFLKA